jgi:hypothetical protein
MKITKEELHCRKMWELSCGDSGDRFVLALIEENARLEKQASVSPWRIQRPFYSPTLNNKGQQEQFEKLWPIMRDRTRSYFVNDYPFNMAWAYCGWMMSHQIYGDATRLAEAYANMLADAALMDMAFYGHGMVKVSTKDDK